MKAKKDGSRPILREVFAIKAMEHLDTSRALHWLVSVSLASLDHHPTSGKLFPELPSDSPSDLIHARLRAEASATDDLAGADSGARARWGVELFCLLDTMLSLRNRHFDRAKAHASLEKGIHRGRPRSQPTATENPLAALNPRFVKRQARRPGRKRLLDVSDELLLEFLDMNADQKTSERTKLRALATYCLKSQGMHTAGARVDEVAANLQRRVAEARAHARKLR